MMTILRSAISTRLVVGIDPPSSSTRVMPATVAWILTKTGTKIYNIPDHQPPRNCYLNHETIVIIIIAVHFAPQDAIML